MFHRLVLVWACIGMGVAVVIPADCWAQASVLSTTAPNVEYQYQLYYPRVWGWPGPGLSVGGSIPVNGREGISSFYGRPFPAPLGAGVYVNPFAYATQLPNGPLSFGLATSTTPPTGVSSPISQVAGTHPQGTPLGSLPQAETINDPSRRPIPVSSITSLEKSRSIESLGDEKLQSQQWTQAYVNYRNAVLIADDLADAHLRLGFACIALKRFPEAVQEFKRALFIDPAAGYSGETLETVFGADSGAVRAEMIRSVAIWAKEGLRDQDRLFLLGVILHFDEDQRADKILDAAYRLTGSGDHLLALMTPAPRPDRSRREISQPPIPMPPETQFLPELLRQPVALQ